MLVFMHRASSTYLPPLALALFTTMLAVACEDSSSGGGGAVYAPTDASFEATVEPFDAGTSNDATVPTDAADAGDAADAADAGPPVVMTTAPLDKRVGVGTSTKVAVTFSVPMQAATVTVQAASGACSGSLQLLEGPDFTGCIGGTIGSTDNRTFTFTPAANLGTELRYKVQISGAALTAGGVAMTPYAMTTGFKTQQFDVDAKVLYMATGSTGNLGGIAGADTSCTTKVTRPVGVVAAKAMVTTAARVACSVASCGAGNVQTDWVLRPNQHYVREDGAYVFLTDANGIFIAYPAANDLGTSLNFWDGLSSDWTTRAGNCADWTSTTGNGAVGFDVGLNSAWLMGGQLACSFGRPFVCAEQ